MPLMTDVRQQVVAGVIPPEQDEALVREAWPSVVVFGPIATLGKLMMRSIVLAPLAWMLLLPFYFKKVLPFLATRYTITNRRVMRQRGLRPKPVAEVALADIDDVRVTDEDPFYRAGTVEVISKGEVKLRLRGVPGPHAFRHAILNACTAWAGKKFEKFVPAK